MDAGGANRQWEIRIGREVDVEGVVRHLTGHMNEAQREIFKDKMHRYARKADRALILAFAGPVAIGFCCVIRKDDAPAGLSDAEADLLEHFACGNGLLVHPQYRKKGVGMSLQMEAERWAAANGRKGLWLTTHRYADWYRKHLGYKQLGSVWHKGVERKVMAKSFVGSG